MYFPNRPSINNRLIDLFYSIEYFATRSFAEETEMKHLNSLMSEIEEVLRQNDAISIQYREVLSECYYVLYSNKDIMSSNSTINERNKLQAIKNDLLRIIHHKNRKYNDDVDFCIVPEVKPYKSMYIFLLSRPNNNSSVVAEILSQMNYLDKMTREVTFIMPGYRRAQDNEEVCNETDKNMQLTFDENIFIDIVQELENKSKGEYEYLDDCELLFVGMDEHGSYDFTNYAQLDLNHLKLDLHVDAVKLLIAASQYFRQNYEMKLSMRDHVKRILKRINGNSSKSTNRVFIAGSKQLKSERTLVREELTKVANVKDLDMRSLTFEDFATSLTGKDRGRQADYNKFIENDANVVVFIFDTIAGEITEEEFNIAYNFLSENNHPDIFVYVRKRNRFMNLFMNRRLRNIKNKVFSYHKEYYVEYDNLDDLRYKFYSDMLSYFEK